jgi:Icc-related predicted phosphoesterase
LELIAISDIYGKLDVLSDLVSRLNKSNKDQRIVIIAGDIALQASDPNNYPKTVSNIFALLSTKCRMIFYVPGEYDSKDLSVQSENIVNLDRRGYYVEVGGISLALVGVGGAPNHSIREGEPTTYLWNEQIPIVSEGIDRDLKISLEKAMLGRRPDYVILVTHSPPYGVADRSTPITLREAIISEEIALEGVEPKAKEEQEKKRVAVTPRRLGSRTIREFLKYAKPDIHIFGHVHNQGGKVEENESIEFFNVSHLSPMPYKLTGRKFLTLNLTSSGFTYTFDSIVNKNMTFHDFLETYL